MGTNVITLGYDEHEEDNPVKLRRVLDVARKGFTEDQRPTTDALLLGSSRSGTQLLAALIASHPGTRTLHDPLDITDPHVRRHLALERPHDLHEPRGRLRIRAYRDRLSNDRRTSHGPLPLQRHDQHRPHQTQFVLHHGGGTCTREVSPKPPARIIVLVRHPLATRAQYGSSARLDACLQGPCRERFTHEALRAADRIARSGTPLERHVLGWCLRSAVLLHHHPRHLVITYEQLVLEPHPVLTALARHLGSEHGERMCRRFTRPRLLRLQSLQEQHRSQMNAWRSRVAYADAHRAMNVLPAFGLPLYRADNPHPEGRWWHQPSQRTHYWYASAPPPPPATTAEARAASLLH